MEWAVGGLGAAVFWKSKINGGGGRTAPPYPWTVSGLWAFGKGRRMQGDFLR